MQALEVIALFKGACSKTKSQIIYVQQKILCQSKQTSENLDKTPLARKLDNELEDKAIFSNNFEVETGQV